MPRAGPLLQILREINEFNSETLDEIKEEYTQRIDSREEYDEENDYIIAIKNSLKSKINNNDLSYRDLMHHILNNINDSKVITVLIREVLENMEFSGNITTEGGSNIREKWIQGEVYQSLRNAIEFYDKDYEVQCNRRYDGVEMDLIVKNSSNMYGIEVKRADNSSNFDRATNQLLRYKEEAGVNRAYLFVTYESESYNPDENDSISSTLNNVSNLDKISENDIIYTSLE